MSGLLQQHGQISSAKGRTEDFGFAGFALTGFQGQGKSIAKLHITYAGIVKYMLFELKIAIFLPIYKKNH